MNESTSETTDGVTDRAMGGESDGFYELNQIISKSYDNSLIINTC